MGDEGAKKKGGGGKDAKGKDAKGKDAKGGKDAKDDKKGGKAPRGRGGAERGARGARGDAKGRGGRGDKKEGKEDERGGFGRGFGRRGRGRRGGRRGERGAGRGQGEKGDWNPLTKLGRLVKAKAIKSIEEIYLFSLPIKEYQIVDYFLTDLKDEVMKISPVQKQSAAGQRTRFRAFVIVGDENGHVGLGNKVSKEVATAIRGAIIDAKLHVIPVRRGYWGGRMGAPHTVPQKVQGKCGSVRFRIIPAPKGTGLVAARTSKKVLTFAGIKDCYTASTGQTKTVGNFVKAAIDALKHTYGYLTPDLWPETQFEKSPFQEHTDFLKEAAKSKVQTVV